MALNLLTTARLKAVAEEDIGTILNDGGGLRGRVRKNRAGDLTVQFEYKYRDGKKYRTSKVEQWPKRSLAEIREIYRSIKTGLAKGEDPIELRKAERLEAQLDQANRLETQRRELERLAFEAANTRTLTDAIYQWEKLELSRRKRGGAEAIRAIKKDIIPALGGMPLADIKRAMLIDQLDRVVERGSLVMANHLFGDLKQFFTYAVARDWIDVHPLAGLTKERIGGRQKERDRYLSDEEITELTERLQSANLLITTEQSIWIMLSTCCRVGELSQARWEDIELEQGEWRIPARNSKNARSHIIYLSEFAKIQFEELHRITAGSNWCIPSRSREAHIDQKSISKQIRDRVRKTSLKGRSNSSGTLLLSGGPWTPHDLRRTGATMMGELGVMGEVIERCLNHVEINKLKRTYQRHELRAEQREAWRLLGDRLELLSTVDPTGNVTVGSFKRA
ncbi:tyrosine-type recombinase/integrase [Congregibacter litoralis]|uniref:Integrase n=1 Tax=Congregibacter litoralis KT71 TaxID=314285 RepID=A4AB16_9GAMM|nr:site-specific integrase [Congregibacter litoralis]EAQ96888.1 Integrase [Congregibacter litoralis KT71]